MSEQPSRMTSELEHLAERVLVQISGISGADGTHEEFARFAFDRAEAFLRERERRRRASESPELEAGD